jgi:uncharacterized protein Yka (UPF0111/DUF47 family)
MADFLEHMISLSERIEVQEKLVKKLTDRLRELRKQRKRDRTDAEIRTAIDVLQKELNSAEKTLHALNAEKKEHSTFGKYSQDRVGKLSTLQQAIVHFLEGNRGAECIAKRVNDVEDGDDDIGDIRFVSYVTYSFKYNSFEAQRVGLGGKERVVLYDGYALIDFQRRGHWMFEVLNKNGVEIPHDLLLTHQSE